MDLKPNFLLLFLQQALLDLLVHLSRKERFLFGGFIHGGVLRFSIRCVLFPGKPGALFERFAEFVVVDLHAVIEVQLDLFGRQRVEHIAFVVFQFLEIAPEVVDLLECLGLVLL